MEYNDTTFRAMFPEFGNTTTYPAAVIEIYWGLAQDFIAIPSCPSNGAFLSGNKGAAALYYMTAHLYALALQQLNSGQQPGAVQGGYETGATIDKISVQMLAPPADNMWTWWLSQTPYGQALAALLRVAAVGGTSVGGLPERNAFRKIGGTLA
jgi:hypothetical protein